MATMFSLHVDKWKDCKLCHLAKSRTRIVLGKGKIPADVLFIGEAPGASEDVTGKPFIGPAGHLIDSIITDAFKSRPDISIYFSNLISCIPLDEQGSKVTDPPAACIKACSPRLNELIGIVKPRLIVTLGKLAQNWFNPGGKLVKVYPYASGIPMVTMNHPAFIIRSNISQQGLLVQKCALILESAIEDYLPQL